MLKSFKNIVFGLVAASISVSAVAQNDRALELDALLQQLEEGKFAQTQQNKQREQEFMAQRAEQEVALEAPAVNSSTLFAGCPAPLHALSTEDHQKRVSN